VSPPAPEKAGQGERLPSSVRLAYAIGGVNGMFGHWFYASLARPIFNMALGLSPTLIGVVLMVTRLCEGFFDVLFGWLSDNTRSRWGRRRPYILAGSVLAGLALPFLFPTAVGWDAAAPWFSNRLFWYMLVSSLVYAVLVSLYSLPYASLGAELSPDYHERTTISAQRAVAQKIAGIAIAGAWWLSQTFRIDPVTGLADRVAGARFAAVLAGLVMVLSGIVCFVWSRERYYERARTQAHLRFWDSSAGVFRSRPFRALSLLVVLFASGVSVANDLAQYSGVYYVFGGDQAAMSRYSFWAAIGQFAFGLLGVWLAMRVSRSMGKRAALLGALVLGILSYSASWWLFSPGRAWSLMLGLSLNMVGASSLWVLLPSMCGDVVDDDELSSGLRREGSYSSWMSWLIKLGLSLSVLISGALLDATGFRAALGGQQSADVIFRIRLLVVLVPVLLLSAAATLVWFYPLSRRRAAEIRSALEARRGQV